MRQLIIGYQGDNFFIDEEDLEFFGLSAKYLDSLDKGNPIDWLFSQFWWDGSTRAIPRKDAELLIEWLDSKEAKAWRGEILA